MINLNVYIVKKQKTKQMKNFIIMRIILLSNIIIILATNQIIKINLKKKKNIAIKLLDNEAIENIRYKVYNNCKKQIEEKCKNNLIYKNKISSFFSICEEKFNFISKSIITALSSLICEKPLKINNEIILKQIKYFKAELFELFYKEKEKSKIIGKEIKIYKENLKNTNKQKKWIKNWKERINQYYKDNKKI